MAGSMANGVALTGDNHGGRPGLPHQCRDRSPLWEQHGVHFQQAARAIAEPPTRVALYAFYARLVCQPFQYKFMLTSLPPPRRHADRKHPSARRAAGRE
jgi:hypothetical protein